MYLDYFSLERHPFRITPDTSLFFSGGNQGRGVVLEAMLFAIESGEGILKVVGEVGSGKTMLCRMLEERLPETTEVVYLANPRLSPDEILYAVAFELKLPVRRDTSKLLVMQQLQNYLLKQHAANRKVLVIIEEAQGMPVDTLEEIRLFSNLETQVDKLMQIILFGQPELDKTLSSKNIRQLRERITHSFHLNPLTTREVSEYVRFRLGAAGCPCPQLLTAQAEWLLSKASGGLTRRINILVDKALLAAYAENVLQFGELHAGMSPVIGWRHIWAAIGDSDYISASLHALFSPLRVAGAGMVAAMLAIAIVLWPESGSIAGQSQVAGQFAGKYIDKQTAIDGPLLLIKEEPRFEAKPPLTPMPIAEDIDPLLSNVDETAHRESPILAEEPLSNTQSSYNTRDPVEETDYIESRLLEGFVQADAAQNQTGLPVASRQTEEVDFGLSGNRTQLHRRVLASIDWLQNSNGMGYTVQFMSGETSNLNFAESFLQILSQYDLAADSYVCMSNDGNRSYWTIKYGNFDGLSMAQQFIDKLPARIYEYKPFVQNMSSVECNTNYSVAAWIAE